MQSIVIAPLKKSPGNQVSNEATNQPKDGGSQQPYHDIESSFSVTSCHWKLISILYRHSPCRTLEHWWWLMANNYPSLRMINEGWFTTVKQRLYIHVMKKHPLERQMVKAKRQLRCPFSEILTQHIQHYIGPIPRHKQKTSGLSTVVSAAYLARSASLLGLCAFPGIMQPWSKSKEQKKQLWWWTNYGFNCHSVTPCPLIPCKACHWNSPSHGGTTRGPDNTKWRNGTGRMEAIYWFVTNLAGVISTNYKGL